MVTYHLLSQPWSGRHRLIMQPYAHVMPLAITPLNPLYTHSFQASTTKLPARLSPRCADSHLWGFASAATSAWATLPSSSPPSLSALLTPAHSLGPCCAVTFPRKPSLTMPSAGRPVYFSLYLHNHLSLRPCIACELSAHITISPSRMGAS